VLAVPALPLYTEEPGWLLRKRSIMLPLQVSPRMKRSICRRKKVEKLTNKVDNNIETIADFLNASQVLRVCFDLAVQKIASKGYIPFYLGANAFISHYT
jgi:hypothetical protein